MTQSNTLPNYQTSRIYSAGFISNPYTSFRSCCLSFNIKDHAQLCGVISLSLFFCLVIISLLVFGALSMFYIIWGAIVYSLLMKSIFRVNEKKYVVIYLIFETLQIAFYFALISYILLPLVLFQVPNQRCEPYSRFYNGTLETGEICRRTAVVEDYIELLLFLFLLSMAKFYLFEFFLNITNICGVHISAMQQNVFQPPPPFWQTPPPSTTTQNITNVVSLPTYEASKLPTYANAVGVEKQKTSSSTPLSIEQSNE
uniref:Uncharacterized protein n=1 Tax=Meloidogyne enterolobii TaxID=390850 RepID=A0A6V7XDX9_MELEN|nr:unnamed protein product [Meloidogyne enterolobii]